MHARTIVAENRLRHESCRLAVGVRDLMDHVLVDLHLVGAGDQRVELDAEFVLRCRHFVMVLFDNHAHFAEDRQHLGAHVLEAVDRRHGEIAALDARTVTEVSGFVIGIVVGWQLGGVEFEAGVIRIRLVLHVVEDEEFRLRANKDRVADTRCLKIGFAFFAVPRGSRL